MALARCSRVSIMTGILKIRKIRILKGIWNVACFPKDKLYAYVKILKWGNPSGGTIVTIILYTCHTRLKSNTYGFVDAKNLKIFSTALFAHYFARLLFFQKNISIILCAIPRRTENNKNYQRTIPSAVFRDFGAWYPGSRPPHSRHNTGSAYCLYSGELFSYFLFPDRVLRDMQPSFFNLIKRTWFWKSWNNKWRNNIFKQTFMAYKKNV